MVGAQVSAILILMHRDNHQSYMHPSTASPASKPLQYEEVVVLAVRVEQKKISGYVMDRRRFQGM